MRTDFVKVSDDLTIHYLTAGAGNQVILLVPGWTMTSRVFERQLNHFEETRQRLGWWQLIHAAMGFLHTPRKEISTSSTGET